MNTLKIFLIIVTVYYYCNINASNVDKTQYIHENIIGDWKTEIIKPNNLLLWFVKTIKISFYKENKYKATIYFPLGITKHSH